jgi:Flp pilus assembly protein TadB
LPLILGAALFLINPDYMSQMFVWPFVCMPIGAALLMVLGFLAMRKVVAIEV